MSRLRARASRATERSHELISYARAMQNRHEGYKGWCPYKSCGCGRRCRVGAGPLVRTPTSPGSRRCAVATTSVTFREALHRSHLAAADAVPRIRHAIADYAGRAGMNGERLDAVRLAVSEAVTNVVMHAYRGRLGRVDVKARVIADELRVLVADDGCGFKAPAETPGIGCGLALITDACEEFTLMERAEGGTEARMRFLIGTRPSP